MSVKLGAFLALLAVCLGWAEPAAAMCSVDSDCVVTGSVCINTACRVAPSPLLFPTNSALARVDLVDPPENAVMSATPTRFQWTYQAGADSLAVGVFRKLPQFSAQGEQIADPEDVAWLWLSNVDGAGPGASVAEYDQGHVYSLPQASGDASSGASSDASCSAMPALPLTDGVYYWGAWGWSQGTLVARSELSSFVVGSEPITGAHCSKDEDCEVSNAVCYPGKFFCAVICASDQDCFSGETCNMAIKQSPSHWGVCRRDGQCPCPSNQTCDADLQICYSGAPAANRPSGCQCDWLFAKKASPSTVCSPVFAGTLLWVRRRGRSRRRGAKLGASR